MTNTQKTILIVGGILVLSIAVANIGDGNIPDKDTKTKEIKTTKVYENKELIKESSNTITWDFLETTFMIGCNEDGNMKEYCQCAFDIAKSKYTKEEYIKMSVDLADNGVVPTDLLSEWMTQCLGYME